jgi:hypothetical protein
VGEEVDRSQPFDRPVIRLRWVAVGMACAALLRRRSVRRFNRVAPDNGASKARLYQATDALGQELLFIKSSLDTYRVIGLNASKIVSGKMLFGHLQRLSLLNVALGLAKVFEREEEGGYELCSVSGVLRVAKSVAIDEVAAVHAFASRYGVRQRDEWIVEIDEVFTKQRPMIARHMRLVRKARNTRIAHLQQAAPIDNLPSVAAFEELLTFAVRFHAFVNRAFLQTTAHPILSDKRVSNSLAKVLKLSGVIEVAEDFSENPSSKVDDEEA